MNKQAAQFIPSQQQIDKYGPAALGLAGGAALGGLLGGWKGALGAGALAGGLGLAYGLTPGATLGDKFNHLKGYWNSFRNKGINGLASQWASNNPDTVKNIGQNWVKNNPQEAKRMAYQYMLDNPEARKELTGAVGGAVQQAGRRDGNWFQRAGWRLLAPKTSDINKRVDENAVKVMQKELGQVKKSCLWLAYTAH